MKVPLTRARDTKKGNWKININKNKEVNGKKERYKKKDNQRQARKSKKRKRDTNKINGVKRTKMEERRMEKTT